MSVSAVSWCSRFLPPRWSLTWSWLLGSMSPRRCLVGTGRHCVAPRVVVGAAVRLRVAYLVDSRLQWGRCLRALAWPLRRGTLAPSWLPCSTFLAGVVLCAAPSKRHAGTLFATTTATTATATTTTATTTITTKGSRHLPHSRGRLVVPSPCVRNWPTPHCFAPSRLAATDLERCPRWHGRQRALRSQDRLAYGSTTAPAV